MRAVARAGTGATLREHHHRVAVDIADEDIAGGGHRQAAREGHRQRHRGERTPLGLLQQEVLLRGDDEDVARSIDGHVGRLFDALEQRLSWGGDDGVVRVDRGSYAIRGVGGQWPSSGVGGGFGSACDVAAVIRHSAIIATAATTTAVRRAQRREGRLGRVAPASIGEIGLLGPSAFDRVCPLCFSTRDGRALSQNHHSGFTRGFRNGKYNGPKS